MKTRKYRWNTKTNQRERVDEIDNAIDSISRREWENTYQTAWQAAAKQGDWERLRKAIRTQVEGYLEVNPEMSVKEAVNALRRSRYYKSQEDFYQTEMYYKIAKNDWNRVDGKFALKKSNIVYQGKVEIEGQTYTKYQYTLNNGEIWYTYEAESPKDPAYKFWRSQTNYE